MSMPTILVIDDDVDLVEVIRVTLEGAGYEVIDAQNGTRGLALARDERPDLILLDVMMDTIDEGLRVAHALRDAPETSRLPILMMSAIGERTGFRFDVERDGAFLPVQAFLEKPIHPLRLLDLVNRHLGEGCA